MARALRALRHGRRRRARPANGAGLRDVVGRDGVKRSRRLVDRAFGNAQKCVDLADSGLVAEVFEPCAGVLEDRATDWIFEPEQHAAEAEERLRAARSVTERIEGARGRLEAFAGLLEEPASEERLAGLERIPGEGPTLLRGLHRDDLALAPRRLEA
jgi:hypothetical protein